MADMSFLYTCDREEDGVEQTVVFVREDVNDLNDIADLVYDVLKGCGYTFVTNVVIHLNDKSYGARL